MVRGKYWGLNPPPPRYFLSHTSNGVPQVETFVPFDALVWDFASVVNAERQTNQCKSHSHKQEEDNHHMKATIQCLDKLWENWTRRKKNTFLAVCTAVPVCLCDFKNAEVKVCPT